MRFSEMPIRWARQVARDRWLAVEFRQEAVSSNSARSYYTFSMRVRFHSGMSQKNRTNKKRKLNRRKQRKQRGPGCGFLARLCDRFRLACVTFGGLGWNTEVKKEKIEQKEAKETKGSRMRIFSKVI